MGHEPGDAVVGMLLRLTQQLRAAGVDTAMVEVLDAAEALRHLDLGDREVLRGGLRSTLVKRGEDAGVFDLLFDRCFPVSRPASPRSGPTGDAGAPTPETGPGGDASPGAAGTAPGELARVDLLAALLDALRRGDDAALVGLAAEAVEAYAGVGEAHGSERYFLYRVLRALDLGALLAAAMAAERAEAPDAGALALRLRRDELARRLEQFRHLLAQEIRHHRLDAGHAESDVRRLEDLDVLDASRVDLAALREAVRPLARKLAARVAQRRRRHRGGRLDMRRTVRRSLAYGGVPMDPAFRRRRASKPDVVLLCDLSGSVAEFAGFTLSLVHALHAELARLRTFVFVDGVAEVTDLLERAEGAPATVHLLSRAGVITGDGHSDYGQVFERFAERHAPTVVGPSTTLIVTGDARTNHRADGTVTFRTICGRAKRVYWLNPEPRSEWDATDSVIGQYAASCTQVFEVRSLRQLGEAVAEII